MKKKLLIVIDEILKGGVEKVIIDTLNGLDFSKFDVTLLILYKHGNEHSDIVKIPQNVNIKYVFNKPVKGKYKRILFYFLMFFPYKIVREFLIKDDFDIVVTTKDILTYPFSTSKGHKVMWIHGGFEYLDNQKITFLSNIKKIYKKHIYKKFDKALLLTEASKKRFSNYYGLKDKCTILHNPIKQEEIIKLSQEIVTDYHFKDGISIVCSCRLSAEKGVDRLLDACSKLANENFDFNLIIIGDGPERRNLEGMVQSNILLKDKVEFLGFKENPLKYLKNCDIYVSPSITEGFSLSIAEAIVLELSILSTDCDGPVEILDNGEFGVLVKKGADNIFEGLKSMLMNPVLIDHYKLKSRERKEFFVYEKNIKLFETVISNGK